MAWWRSYGSAARAANALLTRSQRGEERCKLGAMKPHRRHDAIAAERWGCRSDGRLLSPAQGQRGKPGRTAGWTRSPARSTPLPRATASSGQHADHAGREVLAHHEYGQADRERGEAMSDRAIFHWGSITKTLTAIAIMQLRDRGKLSLDDRVTKWVPELRQVHDPFGSIDDITIRMLLSHSSGFQNPTWPYTEGKPWEPFEPTRWEQLVSMMPYQELLFAPGSQFGYSNPGVHLSRAGHRAHHGRPLGDLHPEEHLDPARPHPQLLRRHAVSPRGLAVEQLHLPRATAPGGARCRPTAETSIPGSRFRMAGGMRRCPISPSISAFLTGATAGHARPRRLYDTVLLAALARGDVAAGRRRSIRPKGWGMPWGSRSFSFRGRTDHAGGAHG